VRSRLTLSELAAAALLLQGAHKGATRQFQRQNTTSRYIGREPETSTLQAAHPSEQAEPGRQADPDRRPLLDLEKRSADVMLRLHHYGEPSTCQRLSVQHPGTGAGTGSACQREKQVSAVVPAWDLGCAGEH